MKQFAAFYFWYEKFFFKLLRIFIFTILFLFSFLGIINKVFPNIPLFIFSLYLMLEVFVVYKISRFLPSLEVLKNTSNPQDSFTLEALGIFTGSKSTKNLIKELLNLPSVNFILGKSDATYKDIQILDIDKTQISNKAFEISKTLNGKFITTSDLFTAYLLLTEIKQNLFLIKN